MEDIPPPSVPPFLINSLQLVKERARLLLPFPRNKKSVELTHFGTFRRVGNLNRKNLLRMTVETLCRIFFSLRKRRFGNQRESKKKKSRRTIFAPLLFANMPFLFCHRPDTKKAGNRVTGEREGGEFLSFPTGR